MVSTSVLANLSNLTSGYGGNHRDLVSDSELQPGEGRSAEKVWNNICNVSKSTPKGQDLGTNDFKESSQRSGMSKDLEVM